MRRSRIIVLVIALAASGLAAMLASGWQTWPASSASSALVRKSDRPDAVKEFVGAWVRSPMLVGEPIRDSKIVMARGGGFMAAVLPHGMRAIALDISADTDAGGFILPNDHVDVILTRRDKWAEKMGGVEKYTSETILRNVGCSRSTRRSRTAKARRSRSARRRPSNSIRSRPKRWRSHGSSAPFHWRCAASWIRSRRRRKAATNRKKSNRDRQHGAFRRKRSVCATMIARRD
jgi:Flp pilus assembly protein CpaB